ncbi:hypothetical protein HCN44_001724 [Aphidius gifuensis]|uniref:Uncharacterized protein n=1 Tax=Aphidius gifuensis TaxID=684658 RepID=A0A835CPZ3_APHGI|nr:hypothetical protein HCN44_001724 [Aphidius gifuensis]
MKIFIALFAVLAVVAAYPYEHVQHVDAIHVNQPHPIPPLHPHPLKLHGNDHVTHIHYAKPHLPHPHLIGYEVEVKEPEVKHVIKPAHGWA